MEIFTFVCYNNVIKYVNIYRGDDMKMIYTAPEIEITGLSTREDILTVSSGLILSADDISLGKFGELICPEDFMQSGF